MSAELTPWFGSDVNPARVGYYQRNYRATGIPYGEVPDYWDGNYWVIVSICGTHCSRSPWPLKWRGLASDPSEQP